MLTRAVVMLTSLGLQISSKKEKKEVNSGSCGEILHCEGTVSASLFSLTIVF